ncbi:MAG: sugar phosphate nucleotidyltransferase [Gemmatimonadota bacterium]
MPVDDSPLHVVILAGGIGSRFWPASLPTRPKPLLSFGDSSDPMLVETVGRAARLAPPDRIAILTGRHLEAPFRAVLPNLPPEGLWIEPRARGTGPVLVWAAHRIHRRDPTAVMVSLHADHAIRTNTAFAELVRGAAAVAAREDRLLTIAARPDRPEVGYGYIRPGDVLGSGVEAPEAFEVAAFIEKPDLETARAYVAQGYLWNTGIFVFPVRRFLEEVRLHAPEIGALLPLLDAGDEDAFFDAVPTVSVDESVLERSGRVGCVRATFEWDDVGGWEALSRTRPVDEAGNCLEGEAYAVDTQRSIAWTEDGPIVLFGVDGLVVVRAAGVTLVTTRSRAPDLKALLSQLPAALREGGSDGSTSHGNEDPE